MEDKEREAIILIHGIGEQRPMDSLRSFIMGLRPHDYWNKPDRLSDSFELRRYTFRKTNDGPMVDCYELYWAHHMDDGKFRETLRWAVKLVFRKPFWRLNRTLCGIVGVIQVAGLLLVLLLGISLPEQALTKGPVGALQSWQTRIALILVVVEVIAGRFLTGYLADAARYLTPHPRNVTARNNIRSEGLKLLGKLHEDGRYQRIIVVGHSLGSVIGYDLLRLAWDELRHPDSAHYGDQPETRAFDGQAHALGKTPSPSQIDTFQQAQTRLMEENRGRGVRWLVTDFITLGSPLAHASLLLDTRSVKLRQRQDEREYPRCPPAIGKGDKGSFHRRIYETRGKRRTMQVAHSGAPFGPTRWSNLYFPVQSLVLGDPVGGPVAPEFGPGVRDVPVRLSLTGWRAKVYKLLLLPHTRYWSYDPRIVEPYGSRKQKDHTMGTKDANTMLRQLLELPGPQPESPSPTPTGAANL